MDDSRIVKLFFDRSETAIAELSSKYGDACSRIAKNILKNDLDAEECVNDTYLAVWSRVPPESPDPLGAYVFRIVRNISISKYHSNTALKRNSYYDEALYELEGVIASCDTVESELEAREIGRLLDSFLEGLDRRSRVMFIRRYWYSDSIGEIAEGLCLSGNSVSVKLLRLRKKLKKYLEKEGYNV